jgi:hypothetical protein
MYTSIATLVTAAHAHQSDMKALTMSQPSKATTGRLTTPNATRTLFRDASMTPHVAAT